MRWDWILLRAALERAFLGGPWERPAREAGRVKLRRVPANWVVAHYPGAPIDAGLETCRGSSSGWAQKRCASTSPGRFLTTPAGLAPLVRAHCRR